LLNLLLLLLLLEFVFAVLQHLGFSFISLNCNLCKLYGRQRATNAASEQKTLLPHSTGCGGRTCKENAFYLDVDVKSQSQLKLKLKLNLKLMLMLMLMLETRIRPQGTWPTKITISSPKQNVCKTWAKAPTG